MTASALREELDGLVALAALTDSGTGRGIGATLAVLDRWLSANRDMSGAVVVRGVLRTERILDHLVEGSTGRRSTMTRELQYVIAHIVADPATVFADLRADIDHAGTADTRIMAAAIDALATFIGITAIRQSGSEA